MKDRQRQAAVILSILITLLVNGLANALPINGQNTGEISDRFQVYFVPAGYVFSIWGLIYLGLIAYAIYQALPSQRENHRLRAIGWPVVLTGIANSVWIFFWHYELFLLSIIAMLTLLISLIVIYIRLGIGRMITSRSETWFVQVPFSIYLGWITVATVANATSLLDYLKWDRFGLAPELWMGIILVVVVLIDVIMNFSRYDVAFTLVILWALAGIGIKHAAVVAVAVPTWVAFAVAALTLGAALLMTKPEKNPAKLTNKIVFPKNQGNPRSGSDLD
ncbi:MAG: TspO/MBR family protein [Anaerolineaceae bacterium]